jgi:hypothetical protein
VDSFTPTFTAVNGRGSPPTPRTSASTLGMSARTSPPQQTELRPSENGYRSGTSSDSSSSSSPDSADSPPNKRPRSNSPDHNVSTSGGMEAPQHRQFPSIDRPAEHERRWTAEPQSLNGYRDMREPRPMDQVHGSMLDLSLETRPTLTELLHSSKMTRRRERDSLPTEPRLAVGPAEGERRSVMRRSLSVCAHLQPPKCTESN